MSYFEFKMKQKKIILNLKNLKWEKSFFEFKMKQKRLF